MRGRTVPGSERHSVSPTRAVEQVRPGSERSGVPRIRVHTAIVHDWFQGYHGAERVVEAMRVGLFDDENRPDIFTFSAARDLLPRELANSIVRESRLARLPGIKQRGHRSGRWRYLLPYMPYYFSHLDLNEYDLVISSSHACAVNVRPRRGATHVCYCYTPMRYAWMPGVDKRGEGVAGPVLSAFRSYLRRSDLAASARPDGYVAISTAVAERIRDFYRREAAVIHPPVDVEDFDPTQPKDPDLFVWAHRLVDYKRPDLVIEAFRGLPHRLVMVGVGPLEAELRAKLPPNVELRGWLERRELASLYAEASGFIHIGEEDFGITMVEALASGAPVIAFDGGGAKDIVRNEQDGFLLTEVDLASVRSAIHRIAGSTWSREQLAARASDFSQARFLQRLAKFTSELLRTREP